MSGDLNIKYEFPILDIIVIFVSIVAVIVALLSLAIANQTRLNTDNTANQIVISREELIKIKVLLENLNQSFSKTNG